MAVPTPVNTLGLCTRPMRGAALRDTRRGAETKWRSEARGWSAGLWLHMRPDGGRQSPRNIRRQLRNVAATWNGPGRWMRKEVQAQSTQGMRWDRIQEARSSSGIDPSARPRIMLKASVSGASSSKSLIARKV